MSYTIELPLTEGQLTQYTLCEAQSLPASSVPFSSRVAFAAAHVVADPNVDHTDRSKPVQLDWDATLAYRRHLLALLWPRQWIRHSAGWAWIGLPAKH